jgi:hypothetical protein
MVSLYYVPFSHQMAMDEATTYDVPLVMYYDISNYRMNLKERANTVMYVFGLSCRSHTDSMKKKVCTSVHQWTWYCHYFVYNSSNHIPKRNVAMERFVSKADMTFN